MTTSEQGQGSTPYTDESYWAEAELLARTLADRLDYFVALGATELPLSTPLLPLSGPKVVGKTAVVKVPAPRPTPTPVPAQNHLQAGEPARACCGTEDWSRKVTTLAEFNQHLATCGVCPVAQANPRPGTGSHSPQVVAVALHPSSIATPERAELLSNIMTKGLELTPQQYYVTTLVKCGMAVANEEDDEPPPEIIQACQSILLKELELLNPHIVLAFGDKAGKILSGLNLPLGLLRPKSHRIAELPHIWLRVTYALEYLEHSVELKQQAWKDLKKLKQGLLHLYGENNTSTK